MIDGLPIPMTGKEQQAMIDLIDNKLSSLVVIDRDDSRGRMILAALKRKIEAARRADIAAQTCVRCGGFDTTAVPMGAP